MKEKKEFKKLHTRIDVTDANEVAVAAEQFGVTSEEIITLISQVGDNRNTIKRTLMAGLSKSKDLSE